MGEGAWYNPAARETSALAGGIGLGAATPSTGGVVESGHMCPYTNTDGMDDLLLHNTLCIIIDRTLNHSNTNTKYSGGSDLFNSGLATMAA